MKAIFVVLIAVSICVVVALLTSPNSGINRWANSTYIAWDRSKEVSIPRMLTAVDVQLADLPAIAAAMSKSSATVRFAALAFCPPDCRTDEDALNVQLSVEDGKTGLDWVLLGARNIRDQEKFMTFAQAEGFVPVRKSENGVSFLRVDSEEAVELAVRVVTEMYQLPPDETLSLYHEGFDWPQN
jgi:hypothetical protein